MNSIGPTRRASLKSVLANTAIIDGAITPATSLASSPLGPKQQPAYREIAPRRASTGMSHVVTADPSSAFGYTSTTTSIPEDASPTSSANDSLSTSTSSVSPRTTGAGGYHRNSRLKNSHKMAERRRRKEMNEAFETLRLLLPRLAAVSNLSSSRIPDSKWDILNRASEFIDRLAITEAYLKQEKLRLSLHEYAKQQQQLPASQAIVQYQPILSSNFHQPEHLLRFPRSYAQQ